MTKSFDISRHVSADVGAFATPGVFGFGFDIEARWAGDHRGLDGAGPRSPAEDDSHARRPPPQRPVHVVEDPGPAPWDPGSIRRGPPDGEPPPAGRRAEPE